jgi:hypothetical protein
MTEPWNSCTADRSESDVKTVYYFVLLFHLRRISHDRED